MQIASLSAFLKREGYSVEYLELIIELKCVTERQKRKIRDKIFEFEPDLIGFSSYDMNYGLILESSAFIKSIYKKAKIIVGGHSASLAPEDYIEYDSIDYVCMGEGEYVLKDLLEAMKDERDVSSILGVWSKTLDGVIHRNPARPLIKDLDTLPFIDRSIVRMGKLNLDYLPMLASRGCPFSCTYCSNSSMRNLYPNPTDYVRFRSAQNIIEEIKLRQSDYKFKVVAFYDDLFVLNFRLLKEFGELYKKEFPAVPFHALTYPTVAVDEKLIKYLKDIGCEQLFMGVESGSEKLRERVLNRKMSNETILKVAKLCRKYKLNLGIYMMVGLPEETLLDLLKTLWLNLKIRAKWGQTSIFYPFKNTPLYKYCLEKGLISEKRRQEIFVFSYETSLNYGIPKRCIIILFKWLNSSIPVILNFHFSVVILFFKIVYRILFLHQINYSPDSQMQD